MSEREAFLQAIRHDPEDDTPRLIFADWLEEHGDPQGEFIRIQCELAQFVPSLDRRTELLHREQELLWTHREEWLGSLPLLDESIRFHRGLPQLRLTWDQWNLLNDDVNLRRDFVQAGVQQVQLTALPEMGAFRAVQSLMRHLHTLDISNNPNLRWSSLLAMTQAGWFDHLHTLLARNLPLLANDWSQYRNTPLLVLPHLDIEGSCPPGFRRETDCVAQPGKGFWNSFAMRFLAIPKGEFRMGSPLGEKAHEADESLHTVRLTRPFYLSRFPVTQWQYQAVMGHNPSRFTPDKGGSLWHPVEQVSWEDAYEFCQRLSAAPAERLASRHYRLPTEAEWEFACRAGTTTPYYFGHEMPIDGANILNRVGATTPVGSYPCNAFGMFDMHGNVREWCADWYDRRYYSQSPLEDPPGPKNGESRVLRGGSWDVVAVEYCRSAYRVYFSPTGKLVGVGFRVVCEML